MRYSKPPPRMRCWSVRVWSFDGVDDRVSLPAITDLQGDVTMETWVRLDAPPTENTLLMSSQCTSLWMNADELYVGTIDKCDISPGCSTGWNNSSEWVASNAPGGDGGFAWNDWDGSWHIAVTISDEHRGELFINGEYMGQKTLSRDGCISTPTTGELGRHSSLGGAMAGQMAAARFVSGMLYSEDFSPQYPLPTATNTVAHYQMADSATSTTLKTAVGMALMPPLTMAHGCPADRPVSKALPHVQCMHGVQDRGGTSWKCAMSQQPAWSPLFCTHQL